MLNVLNLFKTTIPVYYVSLLLIYFGNVSNNQLPPV